MAGFLTYSTFYTKEEAEAFAALLDANNILFDAERLRAPLDNLYLGEDSEPRYQVRVLQQDFGKVESLLKLEMEKQIAHLPADYYLFQFSNEELMEVISQPDEWNHLDQTLARQLLAKRNLPVDTYRSDNTLREEDAYKPARIETGWLLLAYLIAVLLPFAGILLGLLFGAPRTLKNGTQAPLFDGLTRLQGWIILGIGILRTLQFFFISF